MAITAADRVREHPRHLVLAVAVGGLLAGGRLPVLAVLAMAAGISLAAVAVPLVRGVSAGVALAMIVVLGAAVATQRSGALERSALGPRMGTPLTAEATVLTAARPEAFGGRRLVVRLEGEPVLARLPARMDAAGAPEVGAIVLLAGRLVPPDRTARALHAHAVMRLTTLTETGRRRGGPAGLVDAVRRRAERTLEGPLPAAESALLRGMVLGEDEGLPVELRDDFRAAGLSHLVAASGQNVLLLAALALGLAAVAGLGLRARWGLVAALIALYVPLAGGGPSIQRAGIMGAATLAATLAGRPASRWYALLLAAAVTLVLDPRSAGDAGWQLSFAAVIGIAVLASRGQRRLRAAGLPRSVAEAVAVTAAATLATAPLIALRFDRTSLVSLPVNVLAAPAVAPVMWLGMVAAAVGQLAPAAARPLTMLAGLPLGYLVWLARAAAAVPDAQVAVPAGIVTALAGVGAVALGGPARATAGGARSRSAWSWRAVMAGALLVVGMVALRGRRTDGPAPPAPGTLRVTALDVGQGDATLLQAGGHAALIDAGPPGAPVVAGLRRAGVRRLDVLVLTHAQADHEGAAPAVLRTVPVDVLLDGRDGDRSPGSRAVDQALLGRRTRTVAAHAGEVVGAGALSLRILWPPATAGLRGGDPNDRAVVAVAAAYGARALLTADAESPILAPLALGRVDVLKVSHHGSADDGLPGLLARLRPRVALIEVGRHNTYGHPAPATVAALAAAVPAVRRTDRDGTVRVDLHAGGATVTASGGGGDAGV